VSRKFWRGLQGLQTREVLPLNVTPLQDADHLRIEGDGGFGSHLGHRFMKRQSLAVLAIGSEGIQAARGGEDAASDRNRLSGQAVRIAAAIPFLMMGAHDGYDGIREVDLFEN